MLNFSSLAGLGLPEKFMVEVPEVIWWDGFQVTTMSNLNEVVFELFLVELSYVWFWQLKNVISCYHPKPS